MMKIWPTVFQSSVMKTCIENTCFDNSLFMDAVTYTTRKIRIYSSIYFFLPALYLPDMRNDETEIKHLGRM